MGSADDAYRLLVARLTTALRPKGFAGRGGTFLLEREGNLLVVGLQKSQKSSRQSISCTVNLGVASGRLLRFFSVQRVPGKPPSECHWTERLGLLLPGPADRWWTLETRTDPSPVLQELEESVLSSGLPALEQVHHDEALKALWMSGRSPGLTNLQRLKYLSVLVAALGPRDDFETTMSDLKKVSPAAATLVERRLRCPGAAEDLLGIWHSDPGDGTGKAQYGRATLDFRDDGRLTYSTTEEGREQRIELTFRVEGDVIVTDQPSSRREEHTRFSIEGGNRLSLWFQGEQSMYLRTEN
jgi:hypothetical protein